MPLSVELRWFLQGDSQKLFEWFVSSEIHGSSAGGGLTPRTDYYVLDSMQPKLGLKYRGVNTTRVEIKVLVAAREEHFACHGLTGPVETWVKLDTASVTLDAQQLIEVQKLRWMRKLAVEEGSMREVPLGADEKPSGSEGLPDNGCNVELTRVDLPGIEQHWSYAFEAFGNYDVVERCLSQAVEFMCDRQPPSLGAGVCSNYPEWLARCSALQKQSFP